MVLSKNVVNLPKFEILEPKHQTTIKETTKNIFNLFTQTVSNKLYETTQKISAGVQEFRVGLGELVSYTADKIIDTAPPVILNPIKQTYKKVESRVQNMITDTKETPSKLSSTDIEQEHQSALKNITEIKHELSILRYQKIGLITKIRKNPTSSLITQREQDIIQIEEKQKQLRLTLEHFDSKRQTLWKLRQQYKKEIANTLTSNATGSNEALTKRTNVTKSNNSFLQLQTFAKLMSYDNIFAIAEYNQGSFNKVRLYVQENAKKLPTYIGNIELNMIVSRLNNESQEAKSPIIKNCIKIIENINSSKNNNLIQRYQSIISLENQSLQPVVKKPDKKLGEVDLYKFNDLPAKFI